MAMRSMFGSLWRIRMIERATLARANASLPDVRNCDSAYPRIRPKAAIVE